jgi:glycosyltransferase involved in cell wall biosynthesis
MGSRDTRIDGKQRIRLLMTSTSYPVDAHDWQGRFIADLVYALARQPGFTIRLWSPPGDLPSNVTASASPVEQAWLRQLMTDGGIAAALRKRPRFLAASILKLLYYLGSAYRRQPVADVAHVHWLQNALPLLGTRTPVLVSVLGSDYALLEKYGMAGFLRLVLRNRSCIIAPNASWMVPKLNRLFGDIARVRAIPFGVDDSWFAVNRSSPGIDRKVWIVVSRLTAEKIGPLFDWHAATNPQQHELHLFGPLDPTVRLPAWAHYHGPVSPEVLASNWYPRASALVTLSQHSEGRPQVILEAMAAGVPIIASDLAAHRDVVASGVNGWIVTDGRAYAHAIAALGNTDLNIEMGKNARRMVKTEFGTWDDCAQRFSKAYRDLIAWHQK